MNLLAKHHVWKAWLAILIVLSASAPVYAAPLTPAFPPPPEWPIIGPILRWIGLAPEEVELLPDPTLPEYRLETLDDAQQLIEEIGPDTRVRLIAADADLNAIIRDNIGDVEGVDSVIVTFDQKTVKIEVTLDRSVVEDNGVKLPFFISGEQLSGSVTLTPETANCRITSVKVKGLRLNKTGLGLFNGLAENAINATLAEVEWDERVCIEQIFLTPGEIAVEGYYTE